MSNAVVNKNVSDRAKKGDKKVENVGNMPIMGGVCLSTS